MSKKARQTTKSGKPRSYVVSDLEKPPVSSRADSVCKVLFLSLCCLALAVVGLVVVGAKHGSIASDAATMFTGAVVLITAMAMGALWFESTHKLLRALRDLVRAIRGGKGS